MFKPITIVVIVFTCLYLGYIAFEHFYCSFLRKKIKKVIHINGIRGKSTVTRLIDAGLREFGFKVVSKTTGTVPTYIDINNKENKIKRLGPANIREQIRTLRKAVKEGAEYLVIECMAVNPELQDICEHKILNSDITVITNVRYDHLDVMGDSLESIASSLANTTPINGKVILGENNEKIVNVFNKSCQKYNSELIIVNSYEGEEDLDTFKENIAVALEVAYCLNLDKDKFFNGMKNYLHDPGALKVTKVNDSTFINGFSINDPDSIIEVYNDLNKRFKELSNINKKDIVLLLNERGDRFFRTKQHIEMLEKMEFKKVYISGDNTSYIKKELDNKNIDCEVVSKIEEINNEKVIFGCGNIKGFGFKVIDYYEKGDK